jgi:hypothetical protein
LFVTVVVLEHAIRSELSPGDHRISEYAVGPTGWLMTAGFLAWATALALTAVALQRARPRPSVVGGILTGLIALSSIGALGTALFETGTSAGKVPPGRHLTASNHAHDIASGALEWGLFAAAVCSLALDNSSRLRKSTIALLAGALVFSVLFSDAILGLPGARQRALLGIACAWQLVLLRGLDD